MKVSCHVSRSPRRGHFRSRMSEGAAAFVEEGTPWPPQVVDCGCSRRARMVRHLRVGLGALVPVLARACEEVGAGGEGVAVEVESRRQERLYLSSLAPRDLASPGTRCTCRCPEKEPTGAAAELGGGDGDLGGGDGPAQDGVDPRKFAGHEPLGGELVLQLVVRRGGGWGSLGDGVSRVDGSG